MSRGTAQHMIRVDPDLWQAFGQVAEARGTNRAALLREYMRHEVERQEAATGDLFDSLPAPRRRPA